MFVCQSVCHMLFWMHIEITSTLNVFSTHLTIIARLFWKILVGLAYWLKIPPVQGECELYWQSVSGTGRVWVVLGECEWFMESVGITGKLLVVYGGCGWYSQGLWVAG